MIRFLARRIVHSAVIVFIVVTATFFLIHLAPGDPATAQFRGWPVPPEVIEQYRRNWGLDRPLYQQYALYLANIVRGDLGQSFSLGRPVSEVIAAALPNTVFLAAAALGISFAIGRYHQRSSNSIAATGASTGRSISSTRCTWLTSFAAISGSRFRSTGR